MKGKDMRSAVIGGVGILALVSLCGFDAIAADVVDARDIMKKVHDRDDGDRQVLDMEMIIIDQAGNKRIRGIHSLRKYVGKDKYSVTFFLSPADVKDTGFLTYDYDDEARDDDQWLYLPALKKTKRIAATDKSGSFMGSDFNYSDMTRSNVDDYRYTLEKEMKINGNPVWVITAVPKDQGVIDKTGYKKAVVFVRKDNYVVVRGVQWVGEGQNVKYFEVKRLEKVDGIWTPLELQMTTRQGQAVIHRTVLVFSNIQYNQDVTNDLFSIRRLEKGR